MIRLTILAAISLALHGSLLAAGSRGLEFTRFAGIQAGLFALWGMAAWIALRGPALSRRGLAVVVVAAAAFRAVALFTPPALSDDLYRYIWDGRVLLSGVNPYRYAPSAPELEPLRDGLWPLINHPDLPTIYPPVLQLLFAGAAAISPTVFFFKLVMGAFDLAAGIVLLSALRAAGRRPEGALLYLWNPLLVVEFAGEGHADAVGIFLLALALRATAGARGGWGTLTAGPDARGAPDVSPVRAAPAASGVPDISSAVSRTSLRAGPAGNAGNGALAGGMALALAGLVKFLPWAVLPLFLRPLRARWLLLPALVAALYAPFALRGVNPLGSLETYAATWRSNDFLFATLVRGDPTEAALRSGKLIGLLIAAGVWGIAARARRPWPVVYAWSIGALLLVSPVVHPWYVAWLLPVALFVRHPAWWAWSATAVLAYHPMPAFLAGGVWREVGWVKALEYAPVLGLVAWQAVGEIRKGRGARG